MAESDNAKTPPNNTEAERAVLGAVLLGASGRNGDRVMDICQSGGISPETFYDPRHRTIYAAMTEMNRRSLPVDMISLCEKLRAEGKLEAIGGAGYVQAIVDQVPTTAHAEYYVSLIREKHLRRLMIDRARTVIAKCFDEASGADPQALLGEAEKSFMEIETTSGNTMPWDAAVDDAFRRIDRMFSSQGKNLEGLSTGLRFLDEKLQGLKNAEMIVIAARPSVGKTSLALNIAESAARGEMLGMVPVPGTRQMLKPTPDGGKRHPVLVFSLEMPVEALSKRMVGGRANINLWRLNRGLCSHDERQKMTNNLMVAAGELKEAPIYVDDTASLDVMDLRARARRMKKAHGIELIVIDYLQLCRCTEYARQGRQIEVSQISQQIKAMAKELRIPVIVLSQLSRANEQRGDKNEKPKLSDLRDSGAIEQDADVVFLLRRPSRTAGADGADDQNLAIVDVAKNRNGETGEVKCDFIGEYTRFYDRPIAVGERDDAPPPEPEPQYVNDTIL